MEWRCAMTYILCALENAERKAGEEVTSCQQTSGWSEGETGVLFQEIRHLVQLWNVVSVEDIVIL